MSHPALPPAVSRPWLAVAAAVWALFSIVGSDVELEPIRRGHLVVEGVVVIDVVAGRFGPWTMLDSDVGPLALDLKPDQTPTLGDRVRVEGVADGVAGSVRGQSHRSWVRVVAIDHLGSATSPHLVMGNSVRHRVMDQLAPFDDGRALLAGFLIGDVSELDRSDIEAMRLTGLSHFVAVSGSNVALFLLLMALAAGPLAWGPKRRAVLGLIGLPVYAAATRFEPSVLRASVMAGIALGARLLSVVFETWQLLALAVIVLVVVDPSITGNVGFQLSVAATAGVVVGARWPIPGGRLQRSLAVTIGAQVAVAPLLLFHFGSIPLLSPLTNLVAAPMVAGATVLGAVGAAGVGPITDVAAWLAELVLTIARGAAGWPQLTALPFVSLTLVVLVLVRWPRWRPVGAVAVAAAVLIVVFAGGGRLPDPGVVVLDVGQGDAILINGGGGRFALVDGGPDPLVLASKLRQYGVRSLDLVVLTHVHADHATGLTGLVGRLPIGEVWASTGPHQTPASRDLFAAMDGSGIALRTPSVGEVRVLGALSLVVEGPIRRYASPNDQSIVLTVTGPARSMLLTGDIEVVAQKELSRLRADVLKVPHQGAATSDPDWLVGVGAELAVISVGPNQFGHPADWVIELFESSRTRVVRTDLNGDIPVDL